MLPRSNAKFQPHTTAAIVVIAIVATSWLFVEAKLPYKIELEGATYTMKSELITSNGKISLEEFHSDQQRRSRVNYRMGNRLRVPAGFLESRGSFFTDDQEAFDVNAHSCRNIGRAAIGKALQIDMLDGNDIAPFHVIGAARLLINIGIKSGEFEPVLVDGKPSADTFVGIFGHYRVTIYYKDGHVLALGVPSIIHVFDTKSFYAVTVRLKLVTLLKSNEMVSIGSGLAGARQPSDSANELLIDVFAIDRARGCAKTSSNILDNKRRFSFKANLLANEMRPVQLAVGFEPELATLRVDHSYGLLWSQTISNFRHGRSYNIVRRVPGGEGLRSNDDYYDARQANGISCVVTQAGMAGNLKEPGQNTVPLDLMLHGASRVAYLGLARVRGIDAHIYEAQDSRLPAWLDLPSVYESEEGTQDLRAGRLPDDKSLRKLTTVFYFSGPLSMDDSKLLLIEIFTSTNVNLYTIPIYELSWDIRPNAPTGERWEDFFSLSDTCLAPSTGNNHYARLTMQYKVAKSDNSSRNSGGFADSEWILGPAKRNVALSKAIQDQLGVPSTLIYDLKSRSTGVAKMDGLDEVIVSMLVAERKQAPIMLKYLGRSRAETREDRQVANVISFRDCLELAAHRHRETLFAYSNEHSQCYIYNGKREPSDPKSAGYAFAMYPGGQLEVYRTVYDAESELAQDDHIAKLEETRNRILGAGRISLENPSIGGVQRSINLRVMKVEIEQLNEKIAYDLDDHHLADINKFPGLGLVPDDPQNKLVETKEISDGPITFEQCQEACLIDFECEAYSTCIVQGKIQCVLSSVDFKVPTTVIELMLLKDKKSKLGEVSKIKLNGAGEPEVSTQTVDLSSIHIKKHPTCELHNKLYRDVFKPAGLSKVDLKGRLLRPVANSEECAEFCFLGTLATMRKEVRRLHKTTHGKDDPGLTEGYSASHCGHYFYLDQQKLASSKMKIPAEQIIGVNTDGATRGYCVFDDGSTAAKDGSVPEKQDGKEKQESDHTELTSLIFELRKFELDFTILYKKMHGVSLSKSQMGPVEAAAYEKMLGNLGSTREHLEIMRTFIQAGGNTAKMGWADGARDCARMCFTQSTGLWPACQSFEFIELNMQRTATKMTGCVFNTRTMSELRALGRNDLIREDGTQEFLRAQAGDEIQVWHYEPRQGLVALSVEQEYQVIIDQSESQFEELKSLASNRLSVSTFTLFLTICVLVLAGLSVGMRMSSSLKIEQILSRLGSANGHTRGDKQSLVDYAESL